MKTPAVVALVVLAAAIVGLMAFAVGVGVGLSLAPTMFGDETPAATDRNSAPGSADAPAESSAARPAVRRAGQAQDADRPSSGRHETSVEISADVREIVLGDIPTALAPILVELRAADGEPRDEREVFALPAGSRGTDEEDDVHLVETDDQGRARLDLPSPRTYDVGVRARGGVLRRVDVPAPSPGTVTFVEPPLAALRIVAEDLEGKVSVRVESALPDASLNYPGREDVGYWKNDADLSEESPEVSIDCFAGQEYRVVPPRGWIALPDAVRAPGEVRIRRGRGHVLEVSYTFAPSVRSWHGWRRFAWTVAVEGVATAEGTSSDDLVDWLEPGKALGSISKSVTLVAPAPTGTLRWSGPGIVEGRAAFDARDSSAVTIEVVAQDGAPDPSTHATLRVEAEPADCDGESRVAVHVGYDPDGDVTRDLLPAGEDRVLDVEGAWVLALGEDRADDGVRRVAGPVPLRTGATTLLRVAPGGYVLFAPVNLPGGGASLQVARADGAPLLAGDSDAPESRIEVSPGSILGPFEPGEVVLDLRIGPAVWRRFAVTVRAGEYSVLRVPSFATPR